MANQRKQIIVNEIAFWKKNKMLPDHYCDFLTSLYIGGLSGNEQFIPDPKQSIIAKEKKKITMQFIFFPIVAVLLLILLQFLSIDWLAIGIGAIAGLVLSFYGIRLAIKKHIAAPLLHVSGALLLLGMSVKLAVTYFSGSNAVLYAVLCLNCGFWVLLGVWQRLIYFMIAGGLGLAVVIGYALIFI